MSFILVDRVTDVRPGERATGIRNINMSEHWVDDHFPGYPIFPGNLVVEALAQLAGFLIECSVNNPEDELRRAMLVQVERAKFHHPAVPGDRIELWVELVSMLEGAAQIKGEAMVGDQRAATARMTFAIRTVDIEEIHQQRRDLYKQWTRKLELSFPIL